MNYLDMLAKLGVGNAHPGGFAATVRQFSQYTLPAGARILEAGCGTGRTACHAASLGYRVTGMDIREDMITKASQRALDEQADVDFVQGRAEEMPFESEVFDAVLAESVTVFADPAAALAEYARVLGSCGVLYDREMVSLGTGPVGMEQEVKDFYGITCLPELEEWRGMLVAAGFSHIRIDGPYPLEEVDEDLVGYPDHTQRIDSGSFLDQELWDVNRRYNEIMGRYRKHMGHILMVAVK